MPDAPLEGSGSGLAPAGEGWFVVNLRDAEWWTSEKFGSGSAFETREHPFPQLGINVSVLEPGQPNGLYHSENQQEAFLVLFGECRLLVDGQERGLRQWDFFHCPAGTDHIFVGSGEGPCAILMAGARVQNERLFYPVSGLARSLGAGAAEATSNPRQAYAGFEPPHRGRPESRARLPWADV